MRYKPNYCCNCGERIEKIEWKLLDSRKFCELCETEYKFDEILPKIFGLFLVVFGIWGLGNSFFQTNETLVVEKNYAKQDSSLKTSRTFVDETGKSKTNSIEDTISAESNDLTPGNKQTLQDDFASQQKVSQVQDLPNVEKFNARQKEKNQPVYYCGAKTKKGTPCSRSVKGGGRCWQHKDQEAMLPQKDLLVEKD